MDRILATDWKTLDLPVQRTTLRLNRSFDVSEMERIQAGLRPEQMEDKWFIYWKRNALHFHRSWTGCCIYVVRFERHGDRFRMAEAEVNRDPKQYAETCDEKDARMISYLIDVLLLRREAAFPYEDLSPEERVMLNWSKVGRAMLGQHPRNR